MIHFRSKTAQDGARRRNPASPSAPSFSPQNRRFPARRPLFSAPPPRRIPLSPPFFLLIRPIKITAKAGSGSDNELSRRIPFFCRSRPPHGGERVILDGGCRAVRRGTASLRSLSNPPLSPPFFLPCHSASAGPCSSFARSCTFGTLLRSFSPQKRSPHAGLETGRVITPR